MKKTVNINLGGIIFHIDEDAYASLQNYLESIKKHYSKEEGCEEIASDIESRIAELIQEKSIQIISVSDVEKLISIMGNPESYEDNEEEEEATKETSGATGTKKAKRRIYRNTDNEIIGGVCSGIATYFNIDPVIIRLLFVLGLFMGGGVLVYIILWAIIPEAKTTTEKLQMKGEAVNAENIKKTIQKEFENLKSTIEKVDAEDQKNKVKKMFQSIATFFFSIFGYLFKFIGKFLGIILLIMGVFLSFMIVANLFGSGDSMIHINGNHIHPFNLSQYFPLIIDQPNLQGITALGFVLFIGVPIIQIIWLAVRILFSIPKQSHTTRGIMAGCWLMGIACIIYVSTKAAGNFQNESYSTQVVELDVYSDTLNLELADNEYFNTHQERVSFYFDEELETLLSTDIELDIKRATGNNFELKIKKISNGKSQKQAKINASKINYDYAIEDNMLYFDNFLSLEQEQGYRFQSTELILYVPEGKTVYLDSSIKHFIYDVDNTTDTHDRRMANHHWSMESEGLTCTDCN
jgi:phage shock protein PspC (stress-responsive transcriptional regulator)